MYKCLLVLGILFISSISNANTLINNGVNISKDFEEKLFAGCVSTGRGEKVHNFIKTIDPQKFCLCYAHRGAQLFSQSKINQQVLASIDKGGNAFVETLSKYKNQIDQEMNNIADQATSDCVDVLQ